MTQCYELPRFSSFIDFFANSRTLYWLTTLLSRRAIDHAIDDPLTPLLKEQIAAYISRLNHCSYCSLSHGCDVKVLGAEVGPIDEAVADLEQAPLDDKLRELFRFLRTLVRHPDEFAETDWRRALDSGWQRSELESAIYVAGWFQYMNTLVTGNLIPATSMETAMDLARQRQGPGGYSDTIQFLQQQIGKQVSVSVEISDRETSGD
ncbi:MAG: carboxymuconolactone decarboxylase family protein [Gammaproteobacteria bacterium]